MSCKYSNISYSILLLYFVVSYYQQLYIAIVFTIIIKYYSTIYQFFKHLHNSKHCLSLMTANTLKLVI